MSMMNSAHGPHHSRAYQLLDDARTLPKIPGNARAAAIEAEQLLAAFGQFTSRLETRWRSARHRVRRRHPMCLSPLGSVGWFGGAVLHQWRR